MSYYENAIKLKEAINSIGALVEDQDAAKNVLIYPEWKPGIDITQAMINAGKNRYRLDEQLYKTAIAHTTMDSWSPLNAPTVWSPINVDQRGTIDDPITAAVGMDYVYGLYYLDPSDGFVYLCEREGQAPGNTVQLFYLPHQLVGQYFSLAEDDSKTVSGLLTDDE